MALIALALVVGLTLGLLGGGGSILTVPLLVYVGGLDAARAIPTSLLVVGITSLVALVPYARRHLIDYEKAPILGGTSMVGAYAGGSVARFFSDTQLLLAFGAVMLVTSWSMLRARSTCTTQREARARHPLLLGGLGVGVGALSGLVGAGGGFVLVPALYFFARLGIKKSIATSLLIIAFNSFAGLLGHSTHVVIEWRLALGVATAAAFGAVLASTVSSWVPQAALRRGFGVMVLAMGVLVVAQEAPEGVLALGHAHLVPALAAGGLLATVLALRYTLLAGTNRGS